MQNSIPTSKLARGKVVGKAMLKIGATTTKGVVKRAFLSKEKKEASKSNTHAQIAKVIIDSLGERFGDFEIWYQTVCRWQKYRPYYARDRTETTRRDRL